MILKLNALQDNGKKIKRSGIGSDGVTSIPR